MRKKIVGLASFIFFALMVSGGLGQPREVTRSNVRPGDSESTAMRLLISIGFEMPSFGNDPCTSPTKTMGGMRTKIRSATEMTGLPTKPQASIGRQGQIMQGEGGELSAENVCYESIDPAGNKCVEATYNPETGKTTFKNNSNENCVVNLGEKSEVRLAPKSEVTIDTKPADRNAFLESLGGARSWLIKSFDLLPAPGTSKGSVVGHRGNCDPYGITGGCNVTAGAGVMVPVYPEESGLNLKALAEAEKNGLAERLRWSRVNPSPEGRYPAHGPTSSAPTTHPGQATQSGFEKEKESKMTKGGTITTPSGTGASRPGGRGIDMCGRHLPTSAEAAAMGFDPMRIIDPVSDWTGRLEQKGMDRTLTWSKTMANRRGETVRVEHTYKEGNLISRSYEVFDRNGKRIGSAFYDATTGKITAKRFDR